MYERKTTVIIHGTAYTLESSLSGGQVTLRVTADQAGMPTPVGDLRAPVSHLSDLRQAINTELRTAEAAASHAAEQEERERDAVGEETGTKLGRRTATPRPGV